MLPAHSLATDLVTKSQPRPAPEAEAAADRAATSSASSDAAAPPAATLTPGAAEAALRAWRGVAEDALAGAAAALAGASEQVAEAHGRVRRAQTDAAAELARNPHPSPPPPAFRQPRRASQLTFLL